MKINALSAYSFEIKNIKKQNIHNQNKVSFKSKDYLEREYLEIDYKFYEKTGDFCFENKDYPASIHYYNIAIDVLCDNLYNKKGKTLEKIKKQSNDNISTQRILNNHQKELEEFYSTPIIIRIFKKKPNVNQKIECFEDIQPYLKEVVVLSNLFNKASSAYFLSGEIEQSEKYNKISQNIIKYTKNGDNILKQRANKQSI